jgi:rod shape determining protein RodA
MLSFFFKRDYVLLILPLLLSTFGLTTVFSLGTDNAIFIKQLILLVLGFSLALGISFLDLRFLRQGHFMFSFYVFSTFLLLLLVVLGKTINGAQSWFKIFGISLQPIELAKVALMGLLARFFYRRHADISYLPTIIFSSIYALIIFALAILQPDLGSGLVILGIWGLVVFVSGIPKKYILGILGLLTIVSGISWAFLLQPYQKSRILNFVDTTRDIRGSGYNVYQSMIAVGSGGFLGKGINFGSQSKLAYLPEYQTDFIFAAFAEEWGYVGVVLCILSFLFLILRILFLSERMETNFEILFLVGISAYFIIHFCVNVGMNIGLLPVTGIPLPFMSAGGTHVLVEWLMIGLVLSFSANKKRLGQEIKNKELFVY